MAETKMYVYKQYRDDYPYEEEYLQLCSKKNVLEKKLKRDVEEYFCTKWENVKKEAGFNKDNGDKLRKDCVQFYLEGKGATVHWIIEAIEPLPANG